MVLHFAILYTPFLQGLFSIEPLNWAEWKAVLYLSAPVIIIDEVLKIMERAIYVKPAILHPELDTKHVVAKRRLKAEANGKVKAN
jgi:P-type Ca2+ transporter type 2A